MGDARKCENCARPAERGYQLALCRTCRDTLRRRPVPLSVKAACGLALLFLAVGLMRFPARLQAYLAFRRGSQAESAGDYPLAVAQYRTVAQQFPESTLAQVSLAVARGRQAESAGDYPLAVAQYRTVAQRFPESTLAQVRLAVALHRVGKSSECIEVLRRLKGQEIDPTLLHEIKTLIDEVSAPRREMRRSIVAMKQEVRGMRQEMTVLDVSLRSSSAEIETMRAAIRSIESTARLGRSADRVRYRQLIAKYNHMVDEHNGNASRRKSLSHAYSERVEELNALIDEYNRTAIPHLRSGK